MHIHACIHGQQKPRALFLPSYPNRLWSTLPSRGDVCDAQLLALADVPHSMEHFATSLPGIRCKSSGHHQRPAAAAGTCSDSATTEWLKAYKGQEPLSLQEQAPMACLPYENVTAGQWLPVHKTTKIPSMNNGWLGLITI